MRKSQHHEVTDELERYGIVPEIETTGRKHIRIRWKANDKPQSMTIGNTPSDHRAQKNNVAKVRRLMRAAGISEPTVEPPAPPTAPPQQPSFGQRIARLEQCMARVERDIAELFERLTALAPSPAPAPPPCTVEPPAPKQQGRKRADYSWLWRVMRYDDYLPVTVIAKAAGRRGGYVSVLLTKLKKAGLVQHIPREGWRKHRSVEQIGKPRYAMNGHAARQELRQ